VNIVSNPEIFRQIWTQCRTLRIKTLFCRQAIFDAEFGRTVDDINDVRQMLIAEHEKKA
jgi:hypothetical protein